MYDKCKKCGEQYMNEINTIYEWCKSCQINNIKTNWTSENENFIQEMQLKIKDPRDIIFEWIPYNQLDSIKAINKGDYATVYSALWKDGPLQYNYAKKEYIRKSDKNVSLKCLHNSQKITNEFLNEV